MPTIQEMMNAQAAHALADMRERQILLDRMAALEGQNGALVVIVEVLAKTLLQNGTLDQAAFDAKLATVGEALIGDGPVQDAARDTLRIFMSRQRPALTVV